MTTLTYSELDTILDSCSRPIERATVIEYLVVTGWQNHTETKTLTNIIDHLNCHEIIGEITKAVNVRDIVYVQGMGFYLVTDTKPAAMPDGQHFRGMKITIDPNGNRQIDVNSRSKVLNNNMTLFIIKSCFDMATVEKCSRGRAEAYNTIAAYNTQLARLRG